MEIEEFVDLVATEPERTLTRIVRVPSADVLAVAQRSGGILLTDFLSKAKSEQRPKTTAYQHFLGSPASDSIVAAREAELAPGGFPADLRKLLTRMNGIHLWANSETGRAHAGIAPIEEWELARVKMYGADSPQDLLEDRYIALSYDQDGAAYVVLDPLSGTYFLMDTAGPDTSTPIARNVRELLDWIWERRISPE